MVCCGLCQSACSVNRPALSVLVCRLLFGLCAFLLVSCGVAGVSWPVAGVVCFFLCCFVRFCLCCLGLLRIGSFPPGSVPPLVLPAPSVGPLGPSGPVSFLLVPPSGYLVVSCDGPVVMPVVWSVVTARLLSSLFLMATKASALCGALPSTPCCVAGVVQVLFFPALRYSPLGDPEPPSGHR